ncbi:hypothetical protein DFAR_2620022 [Desulfarculales bacterium]
MVRVASLFRQLLHHFFRTELAAKEHDAEVRDQGSYHAGPRRLHAQLCPARRGQGGRCHHGPGDGPKPWLHPGLGPWLPGLCPVW